MESWESFKGYLPGLLILLIGLPIIYYGTRKPKHKPENKKSKDQNYQ
jgi:hypothetical protein